MTNKIVGPFEVSSKNHVQRSKINHDQNSGLYPQGKATVAISNTHGNAPSYEICEFCGQEAIKILMEKLQNNRSGRLYFEREGISYRLYGGPSRAKTIPGKYCFHVYKYSGK